MNTCLGTFGFVPSIGRENCPGVAYNPALLDGRFFCGVTVTVTNITNIWATLLCLALLLI